MDDELKKKVAKTGTTILSIVCKNGIVMGSDRQVSLGEFMVSEKNYPKIIQINDYAVAGLAGVLSDAQFLTRLVRAELRLKELKSKKRPSAKEASSLFASLVYQNIRKMSVITGAVGLILSGVDSDGTVKSYNIDIGGAVYDIEDYSSIGSGMFYVYGVLEANYKKDMPIEDGIKLARDCLKASTQRDVGSGYGIDIFTITKEGVKHVVEEKIEPKYVAEEKK